MTKEESDFGKGKTPALCRLNTRTFCLFLLTSDNQLALVLHSSSLVAGDAGVVAIVQQREVGDAQRAGEVYVVNGDTQAGWNWPPILLPGDKDWLVPRHDYTRYEDSLANGEARELEWVDGRWDWKQDREVHLN